MKIKKDELNKELEELNKNYNQLSPIWFYDGPLARKMDEKEEASHRKDLSEKIEKIKKEISELGGLK